MKKLLILAALLACLALPPTVRAAGSGELIKGSGPAVYYLAANGRRYVFPDAKTYFTWYYDFSKVKRISDTELAGYPIGGNVTDRPGVRLVKITTDPKTYAVSRGGVLRWIQSEKLAVALYGNDWKQKVNDIPDAFFTNYRIGDPITAAFDYDVQNETAAAPNINTDKGLVSASSGAGNVAWDGSWAPAAGDPLLAGLSDKKYGNLPPGNWDYDPAKSDMANWRNFQTNIGTFEPLKTPSGLQYGWQLKGNVPGAVDFSGAAMYFLGSSGVDILDLGANGRIASYGSGNLGDGPDVLRFKTSTSLDFRTGSSQTGHAHDDDLVVAGGSATESDGSFDIQTTTIHTGPGSDQVFVRNIARSAIDLGNGANGRTDTLDPDDGNDLAVIRGNSDDFRVFGGYGSDTVIWYPDDNIQTTRTLGPNFFGGGGAGAALWGDTGTDRLVLAIPATTRIVTNTATQPGELRVMPSSGQTILDDPTQSDPYARYCVECGIGPGGRKTVIMEYDSANGRVKTGYFYVTAFKELQIGVGAGAKVYRIDDVNGKLVGSTVAPSTTPDWPSYSNYSEGKP